jgi:hypothetical protein
MTCCWCQSNNWMIYNLHNQRKHKFLLFRFHEHIYVDIMWLHIIYMTRALKYLEVEINCSRSDRYSLSKYRAGTILSTFSNFLTSTTIMFIFSCNSIIILSYLLSVNSIKIEKIQDALIVNSKSNLQSNCSACICQCMPYPIIIIIMLLCQLLYK